MPSFKDAEIQSLAKYEAHINTCPLCVLRRLHGNYKLSPYLGCEVAARMGRQMLKALAIAFYYDNEGWLRDFSNAEINTHDACLVAFRILQGRG